jgi:hypothetical protein
LLLFCITLVASTLSSCGKIKIPVDIQDETLTYIKGDPANPATYANYAVQMHFLSSGQIDMTKDQIDALMQGSVLMPMQAFEDFNTEIGKLCSQVPCDYNLTNLLSTLVQRMKTMSALQKQDSM